MLHSEKKKTGNTVVELQVSPLSICDILEALAMESLVYYMDTELETLSSLLLKPIIE